MMVVYYCLVLIGELRPHNILLLHDSTQTESEGCANKRRIQERYCGTGVGKRMKEEKGEKEKRINERKGKEKFKSKWEKNRREEKEKKEVDHMVEGINI